MKRNIRKMSVEPPDDETPRRPIMASAAAWLWMIGGITTWLFTLFLMGIVVSTAVIQRSRNDGAILALCVLAGIFLIFLTGVIFGFSWIVVALRILRGGLLRSVATSIVSTLAGLSFVLIGVGCIISELIQYGTLDPSVLGFFIPVIYGNWFILASVLMLVSRKRYSAWVQSMKRK